MLADTDKVSKSALELDLDGGSEPVDIELKAAGPLFGRRLPSALIFVIDLEWPPGVGGRSLGDCGGVADDFRLEDLK